MNFDTCPVQEKVRRNHPQRKFRIALKYYGWKRGIQFGIADEAAAAIVGAKFGYSTQQIMKGFWG